MVIFSSKFMEKGLDLDAVLEATAITIIYWRVCIEELSSCGMASCRAFWMIEEYVNGLLLMADLAQDLSGVLVFASG